MSAVNMSPAVAAVIGRLTKRVVKLERLRPPTAQVTFLLSVVVGATSINADVNTLVGTAVDEDGVGSAEGSLSLLWPFNADEHFTMFAQNDGTREVRVRITPRAYLFDIGGTTQEVFGTGANVTLTPGANSLLAWSHNSGATFTDLSTSTSPKVISTGKYSLHAEVAALWL